MIIKTKLEDGLIERKSDKGVYIKNNVTGSIHKVAIDLPNSERLRRRQIPYTYSETEIAIETYYTG